MAIQLLAAPIGRAIGVSAMRSAIKRSATASAKDVVGSMNINVTSNISAVMKGLDAFGKNQMPFAMHRALNDTAFQVRHHIVKKTFPKSFDVKNRQFANNTFKVIRSPNKRKLIAIVHDKNEKDYLANQAEGGIKHKRGRYMAIPAQERPVIRGRAGYKRVHPETILNRPKSFVQTVNGQPMILERRTKKRYPLKRLYLLHDTDARIPKRFPFYEEGRRIANRNFPVNFRKQFKAALATAKRRS